MKKMKKLLVLGMLGMCSLVGGKMYSLEYNFPLYDLIGGAFEPKSVCCVAHLKDKEHYAVLSEDGRSIVSYPYKGGKKVDTILSLSNLVDSNFPSIENFEFSQDEEKILLTTQIERRCEFSFVAEYYVYNRRSNSLVSISQQGKQEYASFSPNGKMVAFARKGNLYLFKLDTETESPITTDGEEGEILNGVPNPMYKDAFNSKKLFVWFEDNNHLAYLKINESNMPNVESLSKGEVFKYSKAGEKIPTLSLYLYSVSNKKTIPLQLPMQEEGYAPKLLYDRYADRLIVFTLNRMQDQLDLYSVNYKSSVASPLLREIDKSGICPLDIEMTDVCSKGIVLANKRNSYRHLYLLNSNGLNPKPITSGNWNVTKFLGYDEGRNLFYYQSKEGDPMQRKIYSTALGSGKKCLTRQEGVHEMCFSKGFNYAIHSYSNYTTPTKVEIVSNSGKSIASIENNTDLEEKVSNMLPSSKKEEFEVKTSRGNTLKGWIVKPNEGDSLKKYPVILIENSGHRDKIALNRWHFGIENLLASEGFVVIGVNDVVTPELKKEMFLHLGDYDVKEQVDLIHYLSTLPCVDLNNLFLMGKGYGGYRVLMLMCREEISVKGGIVFDPLTNLSLCNAPKIEPIMRRPKENFKGYECASADSIVGNM
ncbi:MAG TPA: hypothetical protein DDY68_06245, partial [Porphyromonadaceae bacterium]|nr:hypothetical protein [Porphyromonadaceae bacterium]